MAKKILTPAEAMLLPDCCFGRRWPVFCQATSYATVTAWDISEVALPEVCVIWGMEMWCGTPIANLDYIRLVLGDQLPVAAAEVDVMEPLFMGFGTQGAEPRHVPESAPCGISLPPMKVLKYTAGRRLVLEVTALVAKTAVISVCIVVSSVPTEVPDWLSSGPGKSQW